MNIKELHTGSAAVAPSTRLSVKVIGPLVVRRGDRTLTSKELGGPRQRQILEILLLQPGTPVSKHRLVDLLWGTRPPAAAPANLESYISVLRRHLQPGEGKKGPLKTVNGGYVLDATMVDLDVAQFGHLLAMARGASAGEAYALLRRAVEMASAPLLESEPASDWIELQRSAHAARVREARLLLAETGLEMGRPQESVVQARRVLEEEPLSEQAWSVLVVGLEQSGRPVEGLQEYERCRRTLGTELGCAPAPVLQASYERMLQSTAGSNDEFGEVMSALLQLHRQSTASPGPSNLLGPRTQREAAAVVQQFLRRVLSSDGLIAA